MAPKVVQVPETTVGLVVIVYAPGVEYVWLATNSGPAGPPAKTVVSTGLPSPQSVFVLNVHDDVSAWLRKSRVICGSVLWQVITLPYRKTHGAEEGGGLCAAELAGVRLLTASRRTRRASDRPDLLGRFRRARAKCESRESGFHVPSSRRKPKPAVHTRSTNRNAPLENLARSTVSVGFSLQARRVVGSEFSVSTVSDTRFRSRPRDATSRTRGWNNPALGDLQNIARDA